MKNLLLLVVLFTSISILKAQKVYSVNADYKADVKVYVVSADYKADLLVYKVSADYKAKGNEGLWFFTDADYKASKKIYFVDADYKADLNIFFVESDYKAGWKDKAKQHLLYLAAHYSELLSKYYKLIINTLQLMLKNTGEH